MAFVNVAIAGFVQAVCVVQALQRPQESDALSSTAKARTKGVDGGHATLPADMMHAEKPVGAVPPHTASVLAAGTSQ